jgi:malate dehydrogenase (oxaloacetate-decarboxylating)(NADP+)
MLRDRAGPARTDEDPGHAHDQHGTAIIAAAGLINACLLTNRKLEDIKVVVNGAGGGAGLHGADQVDGRAHDNVIVCDRSGVIYRGREKPVNQWKSAHAIDTDARTLEQALKGADVFLGLSAAGALPAEYVKEMAPEPIIFAMANPVPEITPPEAKAARPDCIIATGRSDFPNQVNNVLGFPFIFRGALDVRATAINEEMKIAAANAIAELAREQVPEEVALAYGKNHSFGRDYIIPAPFDPRLMEVVSMAVAKAAMDSGVAQQPIEDFNAYRNQLKRRLNPTTSVLTNVYEQVKANPKRVIFAEAEDEVMLRAAIQFRDFGYGTPVLVGRTQAVRKLIRTGRGQSRSFRDPQCRRQRTCRSHGQDALRTPAASRLSGARRAPHGQSRPQRFCRRAAQAGRGRCHGDRHHPSLWPDHARSAPCAGSAPGHLPFGIHVWWQECHDISGRHDL